MNPMNRMTFLLTILLSCASLASSLETCFSPDGNCDQKLISFMHQSQKTMDIAIYAVTHPDIVAAIVDATHRGVKVRMVVDRSQSTGSSSQVGTLRAAGVPLKIGDTMGLMHDKFTVVDGASLEMGSYNYTRGATLSNAENQLYLDDSVVVQKYEQEFEKLWAKGLNQ